MSTQQDFAEALSVISRHWRTRLNERLKHTGLTYSRWSTILQLSKAGGPLTQRELAERVAVEGPTLVRILDALEARGLVQRCANPGDRRIKHVRLTEAAHPLLEEIDRIAAGLRRELLDGIPETDLEASVRSLRHIAERLGEK